MTKFFLALSAFLLLLVGVAAAKDQHDRQYLSIQQQYIKDYYNTAATAGKEPDVKIQQLFPSFPEAKQGDTFRVERCISCHVPDIATIGPQQAAEHLSKDFFQYEPNAKQIAATNHLSGVHPAFITQQYYNAYGQNAVATKDGFHPYVAGTTTSTSQSSSSSNNAGSACNNQTSTSQITGYLPSCVSPAQNGGSALGIDQVGCIVCHNGQRLELDQQHAHLNLIINPEYAWSEGAALYSTYCVSCHGNIGQGVSGPPLNNQDRLGFYNEDYYYRCIEYGKTGFEHIGSAMPNWGSIAPDYSDSLKGVNPTRQLSEEQIMILVQFIRHWENYQTLP